MFPHVVTQDTRDGFPSCLRGCHGPRIFGSGVGRGMTLIAGWRCACSRRYGLGPRSMFMACIKVPRWSGLVLRTTPAADTFRRRSTAYCASSCICSWLFMVPGQIWTSTCSHLGSSMLSCQVWLQSDRATVPHPMGGIACCLLAQTDARKCLCRQSHLQR